MKILISPSKSIDVNAKIGYNHHSIPSLLDKSVGLVEELKKMSISQISQLMSISEKLSTLNHQRYQDFSTPFNIENSKAAIFIFNGDVYDPIDLSSYGKADYEFMQSNLRILSGLYGVLKPLDLIMAYRLEMSTKLENKIGNNLYQFWGDDLSDFLNKDVDDDSEVIVNLASNEYFKAVKVDKLKNKIIKIDFKEKDSSGKLRTIGLMAKRARGEMVNYIIKNKITHIESLKKFDIKGYCFISELSNSDLYTFVR